MEERIAGNDLRRGLETRIGGVLEERIGREYWRRELEERIGGKNWRRELEERIGGEDCRRGLEKRIGGKN